MSIERLSYSNSDRRVEYKQTDLRPKVVESSRERSLSCDVPLGGPEGLYVARVHIIVIV